MKRSLAVITVESKLRNPELWDVPLPGFSIRRAGTSEGWALWGPDRDNPLVPFVYMVGTLGECRDELRRRCERMLDLAEMAES